MSWIFSLCFSLFGTLSWDADQYAQHTPSSFFALAEVHQNIVPDSLDQGLLDAAVFYATNEYRQRKRLKPFTYSPVLEQSANLHAQNMLTHKFFAHLDPKHKKWETPYKRIQACGGNDFVSAAENLIEHSLYILGKKGQYFVQNKQLVDEQGNPLKTYTYASLAREMVDRWEHSKGHRENLKGDYDFLGCGVSLVKTEKDGLKVVYLVQNFGSKN